MARQTPKSGAGGKRLTCTCQKVAVPYLFGIPNGTTILKRISFLGLFALLSLGAAQAADKDDPLYAGYACQQYALKHMKTLGSAKSGAPLASLATDKRWAGMADVWLATGRVDAQARFGGASSWADYACTVQKTGDGRWTLLDLGWTQSRP